MTTPAMPPHRPPVSAALIVGVTIVAFVTVMAILSLVWTPGDFTRMHLAIRLRPPGPEHWLGTDHYGRDVASMLMVGARNSLAIGAGAVGIGFLGGLPIGLFAAARRGWCDEVAGRFSNLLFAFPALLTAMVLAAVNGPGPGGAVAAIGLFNVAVLARVTRGAALRVWRRDYVRASLALGRGRTGVSLFHVLPNVAGIVAVQATVLFGVAILNEAALSYLGLGLQPPTVSWGRMLGDAETQMFTAPLQAVFPGLMIAITVLGFNLLGDGLRDRFDPRMIAADP